MFETVVPSGVVVVVVGGGWIDFILKGEKRRTAVSKYWRGIPQWFLLLLLLLVSLLLLLLLL